MTTNLIYNEKEHYLIRELAKITGLSRFTLTKKGDISAFQLANVPGTNKPGKIITLKDFEKYLEKKKAWNFKIPEFDRYKVKKRPIIRQFFHADEMSEFLNVFGIKQSFRTIHRHIKEGKIPGYHTGKYLIPISYIVKELMLPIDDELNKIISEIIKEDYEYIQ
jgi:hypothetical protein